jgi:glycerophosphoryl diester phosphodiesterase
MVIHDATLERTTQLQGAVAERTMAELRGAIPSLAEVLDAMPDDRGLLIEIKPVADAALVSAVIEQSRGRRCVIQSFDAQNVRWAMEQNVPTALLVETEDALAEAAGGDWQSLNIATGLLTSPAIVGLRQRGASIGVWTINTEQDIRSACQFGVDRIITDNPMLARKITEISTR